MSVVNLNSKESSAKARSFVIASVKNGMQQQSFDALCTSSLKDCKFIVQHLLDYADPPTTPMQQSLLSWLKSVVLRRLRDKRIRAAKRAARSELSVSKGDWWPSFSALHARAVCLGAQPVCVLAASLFSQQYAL
eukprot:scaffold163550_cov22-Tisochrysis_lutea.AAC.1